tara:strand:- start:1940 stop:2302 length:363 start_codon:yes stop_codon:yes gene_type:complete
MYCLDTYAIIELAEANSKFAFLLDQEFVIPNTTIAEFFWVCIKENKKEQAEFWIQKLTGSIDIVEVDILMQAQKFRYEHKKQKLSFFDCVGYIYARENGLLFVTGDKEFEKMEGVKFIKK